MRYALFDQVEQPGGAELHALYEGHIDLAVDAEQAGFESFHKSEHHHVPLDAAPSINLLLAALTQRTERLRIGSLVHLLPFYEPMRLYEELCMLDHLSKGRIDFGFGKGVSPPEHMLWRIDRTEIEERMAESLDIILSAMRQHSAEGDGTRFTHRGKYWTYEDAPLEVGPYQQPHPPLWRPGTLETAAAMGVNTIVAGPVPAAAESVRRYRELEQPGIAPEQATTVSVLRRLVIAPTDQEADARARRAWAAFDANLTKLFRRYDVWPPHVPSFKGDYDMGVATETVVAGSPARIAEHFRQIAQEVDTDHCMVCLSWGDIDADEARTALGLFAEAVM